ncbi:endonuclease/exonuclease/phosphatase family protein [uncultured Roseobacter sp.]|uniref:endonuclease/exonuclease/phosphatase family protein n=1 Tax=uncultured Roseobacter sp. TaxID=114847 RepID=UPI002626A83C|nr:endonuclease/exonuclease/phosphatase family protein [uncultured Roseobacter sp.]
MHSLLLFLFWLTAAAVAFTTLAPLTSRADWWIRGWDFPRVHIAVVALFAAVLGLYLAQLSTQAVAALMIVAALYQGFRIFPYTRLAEPEITLAKSTAEGDRVSLLSFNVLMENDQYDRTLEMIAREDPDVLFLMETDAAWVEALEPALATYETVVRHPLPNHYGMVFATRLPVVAAETVFLSDDTTPALLAEIESPGGAFFFVGLHPRPPVPGSDTEERDAQIQRAAQIADRNRLPVVAMGDFNDVAWSWTAERFKHHGNFLDPRVGRGMLASFDATSWLMRFPIDQLYVTEGIDLVSFTRTDPVGSDHFPMRAVIAVGEGETR